MYKGYFTAVRGALARSIPQSVNVPRRDLKVTGFIP